MVAPDITFEADADLAEQLADITLAYIASYRGAVRLTFDAEFDADNGDYQLVAYDKNTRTLRVRAWSDDKGTGTGPELTFDASALDAIHVF